MRLGAADISAHAGSPGSGGTWGPSALLMKQRVSILFERWLHTLRGIMSTTG